MTKLAAVISRLKPRQQKAHIKALPDECSILINLEFSIISVTSVLRRILGYEKEELLNKPVNLIVYNSDKELFSRLVRDANEIGSVRLTHKNKSYVWFDCFVTKLTKNKNNGYKIIFKDISDRKNREESLFLFSQLINNSDEAVLVCDSLGNIVFSNNEAAEMYGLSSKELLNLRIENIDDIRNDQYKWERYVVELKASTKLTREFNFRRFEGKSIPVEERAHYSEVNGVGYIVLFIRDISDRKLAELRIKKNLEQQHILSNISYLFTTSDDFEFKIREVLRVIGNFVRASRVFIFEDLLNGKAVSNTFEWCNRGEEPHKKNLQAIPYTLFPSWKEIIQTNNCIEASDISSLPDDIVKIFKPYQIQSLLAFPIIIDSKYHGFLGFSETQKSREWEEEEKSFLRTLTNIIANAFEQKLAIDALKKSERRFREFAEMLPEIVCETNINGKITFANKLAFERFGLSAESLHKGIVLFNLFSEVDRHRIWDNFENKIKGELVDNEEYHILTRDQTELPVIVYISLIMRDHLPIGMRLVMFDITDRKKAEEQIISLAKIAEESPNPVLRVECSGIVSYSNKKGLVLKDFIEQNFDSYFKGLFEIIMQSGNVEELEITVLGNFYSLTLTPVKEHTYVNIYARDITQKKNDEERLRLSEQRFRDVTNAAGEYIWEINSDFTFTYLSERVKQVLGFDRSELLNKSFFTIVSPDDLEYVQKIIVDYALRADGFANIEHKAIVKNNETIWLTISGVPIFNIQQKLMGFRGVGMDITQRKKYEAELNEAKHVAENASKIKAEFLSTMSHEIRTPMNAVIGLTHILLQESSNPEQIETLKTLKFSAENLLVLINDILDFSKIEAGKITFENIDFNLEDLVKSIRNTFNPKADEKGILLKTEYDNNTPKYLSGDPARLAQILNNLVSNAIKFTENGSVLISCKHILQENNQTTIKFEVIDTGIGIANEQLDRIFDSFTQASSDINRKFGGTGLGLAISKHLVEMQGGILGVNSEIGKGSNFHFDLKFSMGNPENIVQSDILFSGFFESLKGIHILVVEDNIINQVVAKKFLGKWDVNFDIANNGKEAIDLITQKNYDLVLMDIQMPIMDGYEATKQIRLLDNGTYKSIPIIALTASVMIDVQNKILDSGMNDFLIKPFNPSELYSKIKKHTNMK